MTGFGPGDERARYKVIEFHDLRIAVAAGCPSCTILDKGISLFWGTRPEYLKGIDHHEPAVMVLRSQLGKSLVAFQSLTAISRLKFFGLCIEFFRPDCTCDSASLLLRS